jgi:3-hydroxyisobutyrate dehydrogenase-like beta-hydroxyacid dehydrogenase
LGVGVIGGGRTRRALAAGVEARVRDLNEQACAAQIMAGARRVDSAAELARQCDHIVICLPRNEDIEAACQGQDGLLAGLRPGTIVIDTSSTTPDSARTLGEAVRQRNSRLIDAPLCPSQNDQLIHRTIPPEAMDLNAGGRAAWAGNLCFFVGGEPGDVAAAEPVLRLLGIEWHHVGPLGAGKLVKLLHNAINISALAVMSEALLVAGRHGLDLACVVGALVTSLADSAMLRTQGRDFIAASRFPKGLFPLHFSEKDLGYALAEAQAVGVAPTVIGATHRLYAEAAQSRWRNHYNPAIFRFLEDRAKGLGRSE